MTKQELDLETRKAIAEETRKQFLRPGEKCEGYYVRQGGNDYNWQCFSENRNPAKEYRTSEGREFVIPLDPTKIMTAEEYLHILYGETFEKGKQIAYAVYSKPRT